MGSITGQYVMLSEVGKVGQYQPGNATSMNEPGNPGGYLNGAGYMHLRAEGAGDIHVTSYRNRMVHMGAHFTQVCCSVELILHSLLFTTSSS